jgi:23S rRNA G2445 N2-methylase RlmL
LAARAPAPAPSLEGLPAFVGSDKAGNAIKAAYANTEAAGVGDVVTWKTADVERATKHAPQGAAVVSNLPYGKRLASGEAVTAALRGFSSALRSRPDLGPVLVMTNREGLGGATGLTWEQAFRTTNRGIDVYGLRLVR